MRLISIIFGTAILGASGILPYSPPGSWHDLPIPGQSSPRLYQMMHMTPSDLGWKRDDEVVHWSLFAPSHKLDDARSILSKLRIPSGLTEVKSPFEINVEHRCSGPAWRVRWTTTRADMKQFEEQELVFENHEREALIAYSYGRAQGPNPQVLQSMFDYCAAFNR